MAYNLAQLRTTIDPTSFAPGATNDQKTRQINRARERIYYTTVGGGWKGGDATLALGIFTDLTGNKTVTLPYGIESIVGIYGMSGDFNIQNEWWAFTRAGNWGRATGAANQLQDQGDGFVTFADIPATGIQPKFTVLQSAVITLVGFSLAGNLINESIVFTAAGTQSAVNTYAEIVSLEIDSGQVVPPSTLPAISYVTPAPVNFTDFSMFPGGVAPATGFYLASDAMSQWFYVGGQTQWRRSDLISG